MNQMQPAPPRAFPALTALMALLPLAAAGGGQALPLLFGLAGVLGAPWKNARRWRAPAILYAPLLFVGWVCLTALWRPAGAGQAVRLVGTVGAALLCMLTAGALAERRRAAFLWIAVAAGAALALLSASEAITHAGLNRLAQPKALEWQLYKNCSKGVTILLAMVPPLVGWIAERGAWRRLAAMLLAAAAAWLSMQFDSSANFAAFAAGAAAFVLAYAAPRAMTLLAGAGAASWALAAPWALRFLPLDDALPYSWAARLHIWRFAAARVAEKPIFGWGLDAARDVHQRLPLQHGATQAIPLHPHNVFLQIWLETGGVGAVLLAAAIAFAAWRAAHAHVSRAAAASAIGAAAIIFTIDNLSFGAWQEWWIAASALPIVLLAAWRPAAPNSAAPQER